MGRDGQHLCRMKNAKGQSSGSNYRNKLKDVIVYELWYMTLTLLWGPSNDVFQKCVLRCDQTSASTRHFDFCFLSDIWSNGRFVGLNSQPRTSGDVPSFIVFVLLFWSFEVLLFWAHSGLSVFFWHSWFWWFSIHCYYNSFRKWQSWLGHQGGPLLTTVTTPWKKEINLPWVYSNK